MFYLIYRFMKYLKEYNSEYYDSEKDYYDTDKEFKDLLIDTLQDAKYTLLDAEDSGITIKNFSFKYLIGIQEYMLGGYEWNPKMGDSSFDKYIENCILSTKSIFNIRKFMYGDLEGILILSIFIKLPAQELGKSKNLIKDSEPIPLIIDSINRLGYEYYLDFNSMSSNPNEKPLTIKIIVKPKK
jgi:hypothetical protein